MLADVAHMGVVWLGYYYFDSLNSQYTKGDIRAFPYTVSLNEPKL